MKPEEQRTAIAEFCGWTAIYIEYGYSVPSGINPHKKQRNRLPDYLNDLNAMHEAEKYLSEKQQVWYMQKLTQVRFKDGVDGMLGCMIDKTTFATAAQRAEALLRTIGKWTDETTH